jgi:hypothetical protein
MYNGKITVRPGNRGAPFALRLVGLNRSKAADQMPNSPWNKCIRKSAQIYLCTFDLCTR